MDGLRDKFNGFGGDLIKDLRDRRMLPIVGLLIVAIIAVPLLIGSGGGEEPAAPVPLAGELPKGAEELDPVVLAGGDGVRDYRKRVEGRARNPFMQQNPGLEKASTDEDPEASATDGSENSAADLGDTSSGLTGGTAGGTTEPPSTAPPATPTEPQEPKRVTKLIRMTVDVRISHSGKKREIEGVEPLSFVPGAKSPITQYTGASRDGEQASFVVSPGVSSTEGDGNCMPGRNNCQFVILEPGESQYFHYGEKAKRYRLKLVAIHREVVEERETRDAAGGGSSAAEVG